MEKKEQEETARNAEAHQQKLGNLKAFVADTQTGEENTDSATVEGLNLTCLLYIFYMLVKSILLLVTD